MTKYNWGVIGTGWIAHEMADALQAVKGEIYMQLLTQMKLV